MDKQSSNQYETLISSSKSMPYSHNSMQSKKPEPSHSNTSPRNDRFYDFPSMETEMHRLSLSSSPKSMPYSHNSMQSKKPQPSHFNTPPRYERFYDPPNMENEMHGPSLSSSFKSMPHSHNLMQSKKPEPSHSNTSPRNKKFYDSPSMETKMRRPSYYNRKCSWLDLNESDDSDMEIEIDVEKLPPLEVGPHENRLQYAYWLWYSRKGSHCATDYSKSLHLVGRCASVQQWWSLYSHLKRPTALNIFRELSLFKMGVKPMWEDPANSKGGQWVVRLRKHQMDRAWEEVCMAILGEQFLVGDEICGVVITTKIPDGTLSIWNRTASDYNNTTRIRDTLRRILNIPVSVPMEYKTHCDSLKHVAINQDPGPNS